VEETMANDDKADHGAISRREFIKRTGVIGLSLPALPLLLEACGQSTSTVPPLHWNQYSNYGIQDLLDDPNGNIWRAGHVNDVLELDSNGTIAVGAETGGVWQITPTGFAISVDDWDNPDVQAMAHGPDGRFHVFAACSRTGDLPQQKSTLYESDASQTTLVAPWREIQLQNPLHNIGDTNIADIWNMAVSLSMRRVILACDNGIFWSPIPMSKNDPYNFKKATGAPDIPQAVLDGSFYGLAIASTAAESALSPVADTIVISSASTTVLTAGLFYGVWQGSDLMLYRSIILPNYSVGHFVPAYGRIAIDVHRSSPPNKDIAYGVSSNTKDGTIYLFLQSPDGGHTWTYEIPQLADGTPLGKVSGPRSEHNMAIGVSPVNPLRVAIGWVADFYSSDGGKTWSINYGPGYGIPQGMNPQGRVRHDDYHHILFTPGGRVYLANDGGVYAGPDDYSDFTSDYNHHLANLQFFAPVGIRQFWGTCSAYPHGKVRGLCGGGLQDNGNVYAWDSPSGVTPWNRIWVTDGGGDGGLFMFLGADDPIQVLRDNNFNNTAVHLAVWSTGYAPPVLFDAGYTIPAMGIDNPNDGIKTPIVEVVNIPTSLFTTNNSEHMYAIAGLTLPEDSQTKLRLNVIFGLFENPNVIINDLRDLHWQALNDPNLFVNRPISAIASYSGRRILIGITNATIAGQPANGGEIWLFDTQKGGFQLHLSPGTPPADPNSYIGRIVMLSETEAIATYHSNTNNTGKLFYTPDDGQTWTTQGIGIGLPNEFYYGMVADYTTIPPVLYLSTDDQVYRSVDSGQNWQSVSAGLPKRAHCGDLRIGFDPDGARYLYLGTWGRSMWRARLDRSD
jgi:hypothetical protein